MALVLDASVVMSWALEETPVPSAIKALEQLRTEVAVEPQMWVYEIHNVLLVGERRGRIAPSSADTFLQSLNRWRISLEPTEPTATLTLARRHKLTFYDACYLELARRKDLPLATLDKALSKAARAEKIKLV